MYQILSSNSAGALCLEVNEFLKLNPFFKLIGGPYSDGHYHYQAVQRVKQLND